MKKQVVIHPFLFALYPVLFLYGKNSYLYEASVVVVPALVSAALAGVAWGLLSVWIKDHRFAAIPVSVAFLVFTSFGAILDQSTRYSLRRQGLMDRGVSTGDMIILCSVLGVLLACVAFVKFRRFVYEWTYLMNVVGTVLVCLPLSEGAIHAYVTSQAAKAIPQRPEEKTRLSANAGERPDIYYIILDGYGRNDVLQKIYDYDNSHFTDFLEQRGFFVAPESHSNYSHTVTSLSSALNMDYLQELLGDRLAPVTDRGFLRELIGHSRVTGLLRDAGYSIVSFSSEYYDIQLQDADHVLKPWWTMHPFHLGLLDMTPAPWVLGRLGHPPLYDYHRARMLYTLDNLPRAAEIPGPKFVFVHVLAAHPPFVFDAEGGPVQPDRRFNMMVWGDFDDYIGGYRNQVQFMNQRVMAALDGLLKASKRPPVIIVQGDHGPGSRSDGATAQGTNPFECFSILNAYLLPGEGGELPHPSITPINSFRYLLNRYLHTNLQTVEDKSYFSNFSYPYDFTHVSLDAINAAEETLQAESAARR